MDFSQSVFIHVFVNSLGRSRAIFGLTRPFAHCGLQALNRVLLRRQCQQVNTVAVAKLLEVLFALLERVLVVLARRAGIGVDGQFRVLADEPVTTGRWKIMFQRIADKNQQYFIMPCNAGEIGLGGAG